MQRSEKVIIARRLLFKKISIMSKGQSPKLKSVLCNISIDVVDICNTLPRSADSNGIVIVKFKKKLIYKGHDEILLIALHHLNNSSDREAEGGPLSIPNNIPIILSENCHNTQDIDPTKTK